MSDYSGWQIVNADDSSTQNEEPSSNGKYAGWEVVPIQPNSIQPQSNESLGKAAIKAPFRVLEDVYRTGFNTLKNIPNYLQTVKTDIPSAISTIQQNPAHAGAQLLAGIPEMGHNLLNMPHGIAEYAANRLNLIPQSFAQKVPYQSDITQDVNQVFGAPKNAGEDFLRAISRNFLNIAGTGKVVSGLNPFNLTAGNIAKDVLNTEKQQIAKHSKVYNKIWDEAKRSGFNQVPYDNNLLKTHSDLINKFYPDKSTSSLNEFMRNPTLENAQKAQSDLGNLRRSIEEKARTTPLLETEKSLHNSLLGAEKHIEENMFKNANGNINQGLKNKYDKVTASYRENVVPYKYNRAIQAYKNKEILPTELVNSLSRGEFAAKKGWDHPAIKLRNMLIPTASGIGFLGGGSYLYNQMFGNPSTENQNQ